MWFFNVTSNWTHVCAEGIWKYNCGGKLLLVDAFFLKVDGLGMKYIL